jgi:hypothetical protein
MRDSTWQPRDGSPSGPRPRPRGYLRFASGVRWPARGPSRFGAGRPLARPRRPDAQVGVRAQQHSSRGDASRMKRAFILEPLDASTPALALMS